MAALKMGTQVNVRHTEGVPEEKYTLRVEVMEISSPSEFTGRVDHIFAVSGPGAPGEITGGDIHQKFKGQQMTFNNSQIIPITMTGEL
jgi:hypothetical protein